MRRKDELTPFQYTLLEASERLRAEGVPELHAYGLTKILEDSDGDRRWIGYGSLYRALSKLTEHGYLSARWEDPSLAQAQQRPRRRLYAITQDGQIALGAQTPTTRPVPRYVSRPSAT